MKVFSSSIMALRSVHVNMKVFCSSNSTPEGVTEDPFLGHVISEGGIFVDPSKIKYVMSWNTPMSVSDIRSFLALVGYYRRFIERFSKITMPMTELLAKDKKFEWYAKCEGSFQELKK
jgi:hypothetical protein